MIPSIRLVPTWPTGGYCNLTDGIYHGVLYIPMIKFLSNYTYFLPLFHTALNLPLIGELSVYSLYLHPFLFYSFIQLVLWFPRISEIVCDSGVRGLPRQSHARSRH